MTRTDFGDLSSDILNAFHERFPPTEDTGVADEVAALEKLFGVSMPEEIAPLLELERHEALSPTPRDLVADERPFEALILRAQQMDDCVPLLFPLTSSVYLRRHGGWADVVCEIQFAEGRPAMPFVGWRRNLWAYDLPSFLQLAKAREALEQGAEQDIEALLAPVWGRIGRTDYTQDLFYFLEDEGIDKRLNEAWGDAPRMTNQLNRWWKHERALFMGFALTGKYRHPEATAFDNDPEKTLGHPQLLRSLGGQLMLLCRAWFLESDEFLERSLSATETSPSLLVQDARRLFTELGEGRRTVGSVDLAEARQSYRVWVKDEDAYRRHQRSQRRAELEATLERSEHGIELVRATWPLDAEAATTPEPAPVTDFEWAPESRRLALSGPDGERVLALPEPPKDAQIYFARNKQLAALSPSGRQFVVSATQNRATADGRSRENAPVLVGHDIETGDWRVLTNAKGGQWLTATDDDRWIYRDGSTIHLLRDVGDSALDATYTTAIKQPKSFCIPQLGLLVTYGSPDLANGRPVDDRNAPFVRVIGFWRDRLSCIATFPIDALELVAERTGDGWRVGLVSSDRAVAWEMRGLAAGVAKWQAASKDEATAAQAKREAFGEITIHRAIDAANTFVGTSYGPDVQEGVSSVFEAMLEALRQDSAVVTAAKETDRYLDFVVHVKDPFAKGLMESGRGPIFTDFALKATVLDPRLADIVVRAATHSAWTALREG